MKKVIFITISVLLVLNLSGCTVRTLSSLQTDFNEAVRTEQKCRSIENGQTQDPACMVDTNAIFSDIATQARAALDKYDGEPMVEIALYRLYSYALWQSGATEKVYVPVANDGYDKCKNGHFNRAPRDCALLMALRRFAVIEKYAEEIEKLDNKLQTYKNDEQAQKMVCQENVSIAKEMMTEYRKNAFWPLVDDIEKIVTGTKRGEIPREVLAYLDHQRKLAQVPIGQIRDLMSPCSPNLQDVTEIGKCPCDAESQTQDVCKAAFNEDKPENGLFHQGLCFSTDFSKAEQCPCDYQIITDQAAIDSLNKSQRLINEVCIYVAKNSNSKKVYDYRCKVEDALK